MFLTGVPSRLSLAPAAQSDDCVMEAGIFMTNAHQFTLPISTEEAVFVPATQCSDCDGLYERVAALEDMLEGKVDTVISKTDSDGRTIKVVVLANVTKS